MREKVLPSVTRGAGAPSPSRQGPFLCSNRQRWAGGRKEIKPVLKEGHLAGEEKGIRNPLLWGAFKWGGNPHTCLRSPGAMRGRTQVLTPPPSPLLPWRCGQHRSGLPAPTHLLAGLLSIPSPVFMTWVSPCSQRPGGGIIHVPLQGDNQSHLHGSGLLAGQGSANRHPTGSLRNLPSSLPRLAPLESWGPEMTPKGHLVQLPPPSHTEFVVGSWWPGKGVLLSALRRRHEALGHPTRSGGFELQRTPDQNTS